jgi:hypothetical protein
MGASTVQTGARGMAHTAALDVFDIWHTRWKTKALES